MAKRKSAKKFQFLKQVIVRLDFSKELVFLDTTGPGVLMPTKLRKVFKNLTSQHKRNKRVEVSRDAAVVEKVEDFTDWTFSNPTETKKIVVAKNYVIFEYSEYESFESLCGEFTPVLTNLFASVDDLIIDRIGLRYINNINLAEASPTDWRKYLCSDLLGSFQLADDPNTISRSFHTLEFTYPDDTRLRFLYGMPNPDFPSPIRQKFFVLDFDASARLLNSGSEVISTLDQLHAKIRAAFDQCVLPPLLKKSNVK